MSDTRGAPETGYNLEKIYFPEQTLRLHGPSEGMAEETPMQFGWDWKFLEAKTRFEVLVQISIGPTKARPEDVKLVACAIFSVVGDAQSVALSDFVRLHGPAILFPYVREAISSLTGRSFFGPMYVAPLNIVKIMSDLDPKATTGARQVEENGQDSKSSTGE